MNEGSGRANLVNDIVKEMQSGMNPVMGGGAAQMGGPNPMMGGGNGGHNPMMGGGHGGHNPMMGGGGQNPMMGGAGGPNPMMGGGGHNPMMGGGGGHNPMMGQTQHGGVAPLPPGMSPPGMSPPGMSPPGMSPGLADPMGNSSGDPILGYDQGAAYPDPRGEYMVGQGPSSADHGQMMMQEYDEDEYEPHQEGNLDLTTLGTGQEGDDSEASFIDDVLQVGRDPIIVGILFALLSSPQFNAIFNQMVPRVGENIIYNLGGKALLIAVLYFVVKYFMS